jgi:hypothetical protein
MTRGKAIEETQQEINSSLVDDDEGQAQGPHGTSSDIFA